MLAHAAVPHHHHNGLVVALLETDYENKHQHGHQHQHNHDHKHQHNHDYERQHQHATNPHNHDNNGTSEQCALNEVFTRSDNDLKIRLSERYDYKSTQFFVLKNDIIKFVFLSEGGLPFRQKPYFKLYPPNFSYGSTGLRAPPVC
ncbi:MAG: hypothetical protein Q8S23_04795 [Bacteroidales bacterium]|nr:hypothetical protein [Bacteroidales bacterium]